MCASLRLQGENGGDERIELPEIHAQWQEQGAANARTSRCPAAVGQSQSLCLSTTCRLGGNPGLEKVECEIKAQREQQVLGASYRGQRAYVASNSDRQE
jgi:hypothetical protein